jgi:hypothetical protein
MVPSMDVMMGTRTVPPMVSNAVANWAYDSVERMEIPTVDTTVRRKETKSAGSLVEPLVAVLEKWKGGYLELWKAARKAYRMEIRKGLSKEQMMAGSTGTHSVATRVDRRVDMMAAPLVETLAGNSVSNSVA